MALRCGSCRTLEWSDVVKRLRGLEGERDEGDWPGVAWRPWHDSGGVSKQHGGGALMVFGPVQ